MFLELNHIHIRDFTHVLSITEINTESSVKTKTTNAGGGELMKKKLAVYNQTMKLPHSGYDR